MVPRLPCPNEGRCPVGVNDAFVGTALLSFGAPIVPLPKVA